MEPRALPRRVRRALQRHFALPLAELALLLALWQGPGWAATINVDGATCTLAAAITAANTDAVAGGCPAGSGADTLVLPAGRTLTLTSVDNSTYGETGLPVVSSTITIVGQGSTLERSGGAPMFRLLAVRSAGDLTVQDLTLRGGVAEPSRGGGVANYGGILTLTDSMVSGNTAFGGGGVYNGGSLTLTNSTVSGNSADDAGGSVFNFDSLTLVHSTLSGNTAGCGGGAYNAGTLTLINSTLSGNTASCSGGGVYNFSGTLTVTNSTLSGNTAYGDGGGVLNGATLTLTNSTLSGNTAANDGGSVSNTGILTLARTLVSGNTANAGAEIFTLKGGSVTVNDFNLFGQDDTSGVVGFNPGATDIVPPEGLILSDILSPTLAFNGGPTPTHALVSGSPAVDAAPAGSCPATDQRGFVRPFGAPCDIGAVELGPVPRRWSTVG